LLQYTYVGYLSPDGMRMQTTLEMYVNKLVDTRGKNFSSVLKSPTTKLVNVMTIDIWLN
jgi:hypothetical protein